MKKTILIAAVMFFAFSVAASAQALLQAGSVPVTTASSCGTMELTGDVVFSRATTSLPTVSGTITINYGVPITNLSTVNWTVNGAPAGTKVTTQQLPADLAAGRLVLILDVTSGPIDTFDINGVRVNIANTPLTSLSATITAGLPAVPGSPVNSIVGGQTSVIVISSIGSSISSLAVAKPLTTTAVSPAGPTDVKVDVVEGFLNAWVQDSMINLTFTGIPAGASLKFPATVSSYVMQGNPPAAVNIQNFTLVTATGGTGFLPTNNTYVSTGAAINVYYRLRAADVAPAGQANAETLTIPVTVDLSGATAPIAIGTATVTANMIGVAPIAPALAQPPQYSTGCQKGPVNFVSIVTATTNLLIPYATTTVGYDVGLAIANTTADPFTPSAPDQDGTITFNFYPSGGSTFSWTPTGSTGGLTNGVLKAGNSFIYLLSQLLADAGKPTNTFSGYIFVVCNFTNGHGQYFVSDFKAFTNGALMLVVPSRPANPESLGN